MDVAAFLKSCKESGNQAYSNFKDLLGRLQNEATRAEARRFLAEVEDATACAPEKDEEAMKEYNFRIHDLVLGEQENNSGDGASGSSAQQQQRRQKLTLLEMSSIFLPEEWSFTFYEGLARHPDEGFRGRHVCELGTGNGWISIALAARTCPAKIYGLDINPRAIKVAWINLYLNALRRDGTPIVDAEGKTLLDRVEFYESDLLGWISQNNILLDRIVGCIPQVLNPDPKATVNVVTETMSEESLYDLSNYCGFQGYVEDQFGLGLIARAVEESIEAIKPTGKVILNMGGRPGQAVCERLFLRRGFSIEKIWQTRVFQAADTDITPLVEIERNSRHRFEFYMSPVSDEPISARTAYAYAKAGGRIAHALMVYECHLDQPAFVKDIFRFLKQKGMEDTRSAVDLSFSSKALADEKLAFLGHLARTLEANHGSLAHPGEPAAGSETFRSQIANFLRLYFRIPICAKNVVVLPTRATAIDNLLRLYSPTLALVDTALTRNLPRGWLSTLPVVGKQAAGAQAAVPTVLQAPRRTDLIVKLARSLQPQIIVAALADFEARSTTAFQQLLDVSAEIGALLFVDISDHLELSSMPSASGVLQFLVEQPLPPHAAIICGLVKNEVYSDLEISFVVSESQPLVESLSAAGELTYYRAPLMQQLYYGCLLHELLSFQIPARHTVSTRPLVQSPAPSAGALPQVTPHAKVAFEHPAVAACQLAASEAEGEVVRMDASASGLPSPPVVQQFIFEGFARQHATEVEMDPRPELLQLLQRRFGLSAEGTSIITGEGSCALFACLMAACAAEGGSVVFPSGSFGSFVATAKFYGLTVHRVETQVSNSFKLTPAELNSALASTSKPWLVLSAPIINPTGAAYSTAEIAALLDTCRAYGARVVLDTYFAGLEFQNLGSIAEASLDLEAAVASGGASSRFAVAVLAELSPKLSLGGILFAFVAVRDPFFKEALSNAIQPHGTSRYAIKKLAALLVQDPTGPLAQELSKTKQGLAEKASRLQEVLLATGWDPMPPQGGTFLIARPKAFEGHTITYKPLFGAGAGASKTLKLSSENITEALYEATGVVANSSQWTGIPGYCRFVFSLSEEDFERGLEKIKAFHKLVN